MDIIKLTRELGKAIQQDEKYLNIEKCIAANEKDSALCDLMAKVQLTQLAYQKEAQGEANAEKMQESGTMEEAAPADQVTEEEGQFDNKEKERANLHL